MQLGGRDDAEAFILGAIRSFATGSACPEPPGDDERWVEVARQAGVLSIVLDAAAAAGHALPAAAARGRYLGVATQLRAAAELGAVIRALESTPVRWVVLKGPVLADVVYRRPGVRTYTDLDVLVHPDDLGEALDALERAGFGLVDRNWRLVAASGRGEINLTIPDGGLLDLHWHVVNDRRIRKRFAIDVAAMVSRRVTVDIDGLPVPSLDPVDTVLHLALHASLSGGYRILWLLDLQQAVLRGGDLTGLGDRARSMRADLVVQVMLARAARYVDQRLEEWAGGVRRPVAWTRLCDIVSASAPPLGTREGRHTGRLVFSSTRSSTGSSVAAALRAAAARSLPWLHESIALETLHAANGSRSDRDRWVAEAGAWR